jgi:lysozyme
MSKKLSKEGAEKLVTREGKRNKAYLDTKKIWTIGVGHTGDEVHEGLVWFDSDILQAFQKDVKWAEDAVNTVKAVLNQNMFDALVSFVFNVGATAFAKSTMKKLLDQGLYKDAADQFDQWHKPPEIIGRRNGEKAQFLCPI